MREVRLWLTNEGEAEVRQGRHATQMVWRWCSVGGVCCVVVIAAVGLLSGPSTGLLAGGGSPARLARASQSGTGTSSAPHEAQTGTRTVTAPPGNGSPSQPASTNGAHAPQEQTAPTATSHPATDSGSGTSIASLDAATLKQWQSDGSWFQHLIYLYASGTQAITTQAQTSERQVGLTSQQMTQVSAAVRTAWVRLMTADPAMLGKPNVAPNPSGQGTVLADLRQSLRTITGSAYDRFLASTESAYAQTASGSWLSAHGITTGAVQQPATEANAHLAGASSSAATGGTISVWATAFSYPSGTTLHLANGQTIHENDQYVALPDAYLKFADLGNYSSITSLYQPYYGIVSGQTPPFYTVDIATQDGSRQVSQVPIGDVGPWNEDDNWWDPNSASTSLPAGCPVSSNRVSSSSLSSALVDGICPSPTLRTRRVYYYLLYQHGGLPFFQSGSYLPTGTYSDPGAFPPALPLDCPESAAAATNYDYYSCADALRPYNGNNGSWTRSGYNAPVINQSAIDLSPGVDAALGWTYPSNGFVQVNLSRITAAPHLQVTPVTPSVQNVFLGTGTTGNTSTITLSNPSSIPLSWSVSGLPSWMSLSATSGSLAAGGSQSLTEYINAPTTAGQSQSATITITPAYADNGPQTVRVTAWAVNAATSWQLAAPSSANAPPTMLLLSNGRGQSVAVSVTYTPIGAAQVTRTYTVQTDTTLTLNVAAESGATQSTVIDVEAAIPIVAITQPPSLPGAVPAGSHGP